MIDEGVHHTIKHSLPNEPKELTLCLTTQSRFRWYRIFLRYYNVSSRRVVQLPKTADKEVQLKLRTWLNRSTGTIFTSHLGNRGAQLQLR